MHHRKFNNVVPLYLLALLPMPAAAATLRRRHAARLWSAVAVLAPIFVLLAAGGIPAARAQDSFRGKVVRVVRGDEIAVRLDTWTLTVHLHGIETPNAPASLAEKARQYTARRVLHTSVRVDVRGTGTRQMVYGDVRPEVDAESGRFGSLNQELISVGLANWARAYAPNREDTARWESEARAAQRGMWSDPSGENVSLPPDSEALLRLRRATPTPHPTATPRPISTATPVPSPTPTPAPAVATPLPTPTPPVEPTPLPLPVASSIPDEAPPAQTDTDRRLPGAMCVVAALAFVLTASLLRPRRGMGRHAAALPFQLLTAATAAVAAAMLVPLPLLAFTGAVQFSTPATLTAALTAPLGPLCWWGALRLFRREQILRGTPVRRLADVAADGGDSGLVRLVGHAQALGSPPCSVVGRLTGVYIHERTQRYEVVVEAGYDSPRPNRGGGKRRKRPYHWVTVQDELHAPDFLLEDGSGTPPAVVEGGRARFHPLRIARYYNDVPVEAWFDRPYSGDTRTQIAYIPLNAEVTVWGHLYRTASPIPALAESRIGPDASNGFLEVAEIAEGDAGISSPGRSLVGLLLTIAGVVFAALTAYCIARPGAFPPL
jgi:endonuclease YncB( thermonuclease family)